MGELIESAVAASAPEPPAEQPAEPVVHEKRPLTHKLSRAQLEDIRKNLLDPAAAIMDRRAQFPTNIGDNNNRGKVRHRPHSPQKGTVPMPEMDIAPVPQTPNGQAPMTAPQQAPQQAKPSLLHTFAHVPYGKVAARGAVAGAAAVVVGAGVWYGGKFLIEKIKGTSA
jgi:hypothetical protein